MLTQGNSSPSNLALNLVLSLMRPSVYNYMLGAQYLYFYMYCKAMFKCFIIDANPDPKYLQRQFSSKS